MPAPTTDPIIWASDANYTSGPRSGSPTKDTTMSAGVAAQGIVAGQTLKPDQLNQALNVATNWIEFLRAEQGSGFFGDGSDGNATITGGTTTLTRDMYYADLTVEGSGVLDANGYRIFVSGTLQIDSGGVISNDGAAASGAVEGDPASTGSISGSTHSPGNGEGGSAGVGADAADSTRAIGGNGGDGGDNGGAIAGGAGGTCSILATRGGARHFHGQLGTFADGTRLQGGCGGGGGGGAAGGGGGGHGGVVVIFAQVLNSAGTIRAVGGAGADGVSGDSGGGGGGGGGALLLAYRRLTALGTTSVAGGAGGAPSGAGSSGVAGSAGTVLQFVV